MPHTQAFLSNPPWSLMPHVCITEVLPAGLLLRLVGSGIVDQWRHDFTGTYWEERLRPQWRAQFRQHIEAVCETPAGLHVTAQTWTSQGRSVSYEALYLPLAVDKGKPQRCIRYSQTIDKLDYKEHKTAFDWADAPHWIDLGRGVPRIPTSTCSLDLDRRSDEA